MLGVLHDDSDTQRGARLRFQEDSSIFEEVTVELTPHRMTQTVMAMVDARQSKLIRQYFDCNFVKNRRIVLKSKSYTSLGLRIIILNSQHDSLIRKKVRNDLSAKKTVFYGNNILCRHASIWVGAGSRQMPNRQKSKLHFFLQGPPPPTPLGHI